MGIGPFEILIVLFVLMLIIGPRRVTDMAKSLGRGVGDFISEIGGKGDGERREPPAALGKGEGDDEDEDRKPLKTPDGR